MDTALKQRLIGAAVLTAVALLFLPPLLSPSDKPDSQPTPPSMDVPPAPQEGFETRELPLAGPAAAPEGGVMGLRDAPPQPVKIDAPATDAPAASVAETPKPNPATAAGDYAVNFGSYASRADADRIVAALAGLQLGASIDPVTVSGRQAWRVYIGPYASRADAEAARIRALTLGNNARATVIARDAAPVAASKSAPAVETQPAPAPARPAVAETKPAPAPEPARPAVAETKPAPAPAPARPAAAETKPAPAPAPARPVVAETKPAPAPASAAPVAAPKPAASTTGFAVQLGAFANAADAQALRDRARAAGFSAITETVRTEKGTLTRVRLGPVADRAAAERIQAQARSKLGVDGMVRSHP
ncbi:sporulation protein [Lysobacteraceae bacterium NML120232]|nr:sporulation protein [Xanthomonadaceae bacterium NML120232]